MELETLIREAIKGKEEVTGITIDGPTSQDLDDAFWLEENEEGYYTHISIADVASIIKRDSDFDKRAFEMGFTRYNQSGNNPMLPHLISQGAVSLLENQSRPTLTMSVLISKELDIGTPTIRKTFLRSKKKLSYEAAEKIMGENGNDLNTMLKSAYSLTNGLYQKRRAIGGLFFFDKMRGLSVTEEGKIMVLEETERYNSHLLIQELMILVNHLFAAYSAENDIPILFRNHTAKAAAPASKDLLSQIEISLQDPDFSRIATTQKTVNLVLNRARYASTNLGHYGLNIPAYEHGSSPIRRYVDLVNQRQLIAFLDGKGCPYKKDELEAIGLHINELVDKIEKDRDERFKEQALKVPRRAIGSGSIAHLDEDKFYQAIKLIAREGGITQELEYDIKRRLANGQLKTRDLYTILLESKNDDPTLGDLRKETLKWIGQNPHEASSILTIASQQLGWSLPNYETTSQGPDHIRTFTSTATITLESKTYTTKPQTTQSKKLAEQLASLQLLEQIVGIEIEERGVASAQNITHVKTIRAPSTKNYKGELLERCQQNKWGEPSYNSQQTGFDHQPQFTVIAEIRYLLS